MAPTTKGRGACGAEEGAELVEEFKFGEHGQDHIETRLIWRENGRISKERKSNVESLIWRAIFCQA
uniref:Uncharacterized protein n=1 Tax=Oryza nivara TaxID=4536 RepID=A0A0E0IRL9_ORYNI